MKITVDEVTAKLLRERLGDEQPDSPLRNIIRQLDVAAAGNRMLTSGEIEAVISAIQYSPLLNPVGNPTAAHREFSNRLASALPKLQVMFERQKERE